MVPKGPPPKLSAADVEAVAERYVTGETAAQIALDYGVTKSTVYRHLRLAGIALRPRGWHRNGAVMSAESRQKLSNARRVLRGRADELRELADGTRSCQEIAEAMDVSDEVVRGEMTRLGIPRLEARARPDRNAFWAGGLSVDKQGYILVKSPDHPGRTKKGYVRAHRLVMEKTLGRPLGAEEVVDHRNGDTSDNRPENLVLYSSNAEHLRATLTGRQKISESERERLRQEAVRRARQRVDAILAGRESGGWE